MRIAPTTECDGCKKQIGRDDYVLCQDGINSKIVAFHKACHQQGSHPATTDPNLRRTFGVTLAPVILNSSIKGIVG